ncbi:MAG: InlB B-repeat-containing protein, partial [Gaiellales bacterium]
MRDSSDHAGGALGRTPVANPAGGTLLTTSAGRAPEDLVVADGYLYWTARGPESTASALRDDHESARVVYRSRLDGSARIRLSTGHCGDPEALAVAGGYLYWLDGEAHAIARLPLGFGYVGDHDDDDHDCGYIGVASATNGLWADASHVYWTVPGSGIGRANVDGTGIDTGFIRTLVTGASELTGVGSTLLWTTSEGGGPIGRASINGGSVTSLSVGSGDAPSDVASDGDAIYWTTSSGKGIGVMGFDGSNPLPDHYPSVTGFGRQGPTSVAIEAAATRTLTIDRAGDAAALGIIVSVGDTAINCPDACVADFPAGSTVSLVAAAGPGTGGQLTSLRLSAGSTGSCSMEDGTCDIVMNANTSVTATFAAPAPGSPVPLNVRLTGDGVGMVTATNTFATTPVQCIGVERTCASTARVNGTVTLVATQPTGSQFKEWSGLPAESTCASDDTTCTFIITKPVTVEAKFARIVGPFPPSTATVAVDVSGRGSVTSDPTGIVCGATCAAAFLVDVPIVLSATPAPGMRFSGWDGAGCSGTEPACLLIPVTDATVKAQFVPIAPEPTPTPGPTPPPVPTPDPSTAVLDLVKDGTPLGWIYSDPARLACNVTCSQDFDLNSQVKLTAKEAPNADFLGWGAGCSGAALTCRLT